MMMMIMKKKKKKKYKKKKNKIGATERLLPVPAFVSVSVRQSAPRPSVGATNFRPGQGPPTVTVTVNATGRAAQGVMGLG